MRFIFQSPEQLRDSASKQGQIVEALHKQHQGFVKRLTLLNDPRWQWACENVIPARKVEVALARCDIPADDAMRGAQATGQFNELEKLLGLRDVTAAIEKQLSDRLREESKKLTALVEKCDKASKNRGGT